MTTDPFPLAGPRAAVGLALGLTLSALFCLAGGLGLQAACAIAALAALPRPALWRRLRPAPALLAALAFLVWASMTQVWSPAPPRQIVTLWVVVAGGTGVLLAAAHLPERLRPPVRRAFVIAMTVLGAAMIAESMMDGAVTAYFKDMEAGDGRVFSMLGRGVAATILLAPPACAMALSMGRPGGAAIAVILAGAVAGAVGFEVQANQLALIIAIAAFLMAWRAPGLTIRAFAVAACLLLVLFPLVVTVVEPIMEARRDRLPFSWEWRWEAWGYAVELIQRRPVFGWGMDATRTLSGVTTEMRGFVLSRIPLHTHSASLQILLETGLVGLGLACATLALGARRVARSAIVRPAAAAAAASAGAMAFLISASYGVWQEWFWCGGFLTAAACLLVGPGPRPDPAGRGA